jgi:hypothetical protein
MHLSESSKMSRERLEKGMVIAVYSFGILIHNDSFPAPDSPLPLEIHLYPVDDVPHFECLYAGR